MSLQHRSPAYYFLDPTTRCKELSLHLKELLILHETINYFKKSDKEAQHEATKVDPSYNLEDEANKLFKEVQSAMEIVKQSDFYCELINQFDGIVFKEQLMIFLGSHSTLKMVIYALGCMEFFYRGIFQLAIALLMKETCSWIDEIEVYDPDFLRADIIVLKKLGCNVLTINEIGRRSVDKPTLFFIPYGDNHLMGNVFEANWCPSQINQLLVLCVKSLDFPIPEGFDDEYLNAMRKISIKIPLPNYGNGILEGFLWHFFKMDSNVDMDTLISAGKVTRGETMAEKEKRLMHRREADLGEECFYNFTYRHRLLEKIFLQPYDENRDDEKRNWGSLIDFRGPRMYRCSWHAPPKGWMKLNIASSSRRGREELEESLITGYGGICHNESKERVLDYKGKIDKVDQFTACVKALKIGLEDILKKFEQPKPKLIVETDNFKLVHWVNGEPLMSSPAFQVEEFQQVQYLLNQYDCYIIYHVYEEANEEAIRLAKQKT